MIITIYYSLSVTVTAPLSNVVEPFATKRRNNITVCFMVTVRALLATCRIACSVWSKHGLILGRHFLSLQYMKAYSFGNYSKTNLMLSSVLHASGSWACVPDQCSNNSDPSAIFCFFDNFSRQTQIWQTQKMNALKNGRALKDVLWLSSIFEWQFSVQTNSQIRIQQHNSKPNTDPDPQYGLWRQGRKKGKNVLGI